MISKHKDWLNLEVSRDELVTQLGDLKYDALAIFLEMLSKKLKNDSEADDGRGRQKLAGHLDMASRHIFEASLEIDKAWKICKPYM